MTGPWLRVSLFVLTLVALFVWAGEVVSRASGSTERVPLDEGTSVANGEIIFWGAGKCHTCHAVGTRGSSVRGPNLGSSADGDAMMIRAAARAAERSATLGTELSPTQYLVESLVDPGVHLVPGFKDEMPIIYRPPIQLDSDELTSVVLYLQSFGGEPDASAIVLPPEVRANQQEASEAVPWRPYLEGDSLKGRELFFDSDRTRCAGCHRIGSEGGDVGPELTSVAGTRTMQSIVESLVDPSASIPQGYETELIETTDGRLFDGLVLRETPDSLWLTTALQDVYPLAIADVAVVWARTPEGIRGVPGSLDTSLVRNQPAAGSRSSVRHRYLHAVRPYRRAGVREQRRAALARIPGTARPTVRAGARTGETPPGHCTESGSARRRLAGLAGGVSLGGCAHRNPVAASDTAGGIRIT